MKKLLFIFVTLIFCINPILVFAEQKKNIVCSKKDREYAEFWKNYYDPEDAYHFGEKIKKLVRDKNLQKLFDLVDGELTSGPRKNFVKGKKFSEIFSDKWRDGLLKSNSPCSPVGWRGFMLDSGSIWFNKDKDKNKWFIFSILGAKKEVVSEKPLPIGWRFEDKIIPPQCFSTLWMSGDNYEEFAEKFNIQNFKDFSKNPGKYFGDKIPKFKEIKTSWNEEIYLTSSMKKCFEGELSYGGIKKIGLSEIKIKENAIETQICSSKNICTKFSYTILHNINSDKCQSLAPKVKGKCLKSYLIAIGDYSGGTIGWDMSYNIYGLFNLQNNKKFILPLKNFFKKNNALNFTDKLMQ